MREGCYSCVMKHLGEAAVFETELNLGYPNFDIYVIGCLSHAAQEAEALNPELAACIRDWRLLWEPGLVRGKLSVAIPYEGFSEYIKACMQATAHKHPIPALPYHLTTAALVTEST